MNALRRTVLWVFLSVAIVLGARPAEAAGSFKVKNTEIDEVSGAWHVYVTLELPKAPLTAHQTMRFVFQRTFEYERTLVDGKTEPVRNKVSVNSGKSDIESMDVDFADSRGNIFKATRFDFSLSRARGYIAGEYKMQVRGADGNEVGGTVTLMLKGDNEPVDRRSMVFNAGNMKKIPGRDAGAKTGTEEPSNNVGMGEVTPTGTGKPFIGPEGYQKTPEEEIKVKPSGCGCDVSRTEGTTTGLVASMAIAMTLSRMADRRSRNRIAKKR